MSKQPKIHMTKWNGVPINEMERDQWIKEILANDPPGRGDHSLIMSGDSMVLVLWDHAQGDWEIIDTKIQRTGRAK